MKLFYYATHNSTLQNVWKNLGQSMKEKNIDGHSKIGDYNIIQFCQSLWIVFEGRFNHHYFTEWMISCKNLGV